MNYYDSIAAGYDELHYEEQKSKAQLILRELKIKKADKLLDVGCGTGKVTALFPCKVTGIDPSFGLLKLAKIPVKQAPAEKIPFPDKSFDIVVSLTAAQNFDDVDKGIAEIARVAKRDVVITCLKKSKKVTEVEKSIKKHLTVLKKLEEQHDLIWVAHPRNL